jgi:hypothetical protein
MTAYAQKTLTVPGLGPGAAVILDFDPGRSHRGLILARTVKGPLHVTLRVLGSTLSAGMA